MLHTLWIAGGFPTAEWTAESDQENAQLGLSVRWAGDVNGDGFDDLIVGAPYYDEGEVDEGRAFVHHGSAGGPGAGAAWTTESNQAGAWGGYSVAGGGDVNGDGFDDVVVASLFYDNGSVDEGRVEAFHGSAVGLDATAVATLETNQAAANYGIYLGHAGDVNGDGFADVIVGASNYDNGEMDEGRAFVYLGSAAGLETAPAWTAESNQTIAYFGTRVATAGDVNDDGFADVVVAAPAYDGGQPNEGRAYLYLGSAAGLASAPAWTVEADQDFALLGQGIASAGDVNNDGFDDVIVGAPYYEEGEDSEGQVWLYLGSSAGLATVPAWSADSDQTVSNYGWSVDSAGDVNNDGFDDVVVGAWWWDDDVVDEGAVFVYLGATTGLETDPAYLLDSDQSGSYFGFLVAGGGDVNGDAAPDLLVGAPRYDGGELDEGRVYLFAGESTDPVDDDPCPASSPDSDGDGFCAAEECDDANPEVYPGAPEVCDGLDNACSGSIPANELDEDGDRSFVCSGDCDDANRAVHPSAPEVCNGLDDNCDGEIDPTCDSGGPGDCTCGTTGGAAGAPLLAVALLLWNSRRRQAGGGLEA